MRRAPVLPDYSGIGFTIRKVGIGDGIQFTSLPENFFKKTGHKLIDVSQPWYLDHNPYVIRDQPPKKVIELWNHPPQYEWPDLGRPVYLSNAEIHLGVFNFKNPSLIRPRLYRFENVRYSERQHILFHAFGVSHGALPRHVIDHVLNKYENEALFQIGLKSDLDLGIPRIFTPTLWQLAEAIASSKMLIGVDSAPAWIAACYPDVVVKKIRTKFQMGYRESQDWIPLERNHIHSYWDDQNLFQIYNCFEEDCGFTQSYKKI